MSFTERDAVQFAEVLDELIRLADAQLEELCDLGLDDIRVSNSLDWLIPQGAALLKRAKRGDLKIFADDHFNGLLASLDIATALAADWIDEATEEEADGEDEFLNEHPSSATHRVHS